MAAYRQPADHESAAKRGICHDSQPPDSVRHPGTALSMYGTLTGMSLSFILFPTALTGSFSLMLLPDIAKASAEHRDTYVRKASRLSLSTAFFIGCVFTSVFFLFGEAIGNLFYPGTLAGIYIPVMALPFSVSEQHSYQHSAWYGYDRPDIPHPTGRSCSPSRRYCISYSAPGHELLFYSTSSQPDPHVRA